MGLTMTSALKRGPKKGHKQSPEHVERRKRWGEDHHAWKGDLASQGTGRCRANKMYKNIGPCTKCGNHKSERHHINRNTTNNTRENIEIICRRCHMLEDGRLSKFKELSKCSQPKAVEAARHIKRFGENNKSSKLTYAEVKEIRKSLNITNKRLACIYGVSNVQIANIKSGRSWPIRKIEGVLK